MTFSEAVEHLNAGRSITRPEMRGQTIHLAYDLNGPYLIGRNGINNNKVGPESGSAQVELWWTPEDSREFADMIVATNWVVAA